ncbi:hypothetical protein DAI22_04g288150 [Oryza sativa Japonica Group]|nr:hypothetical protein DAI22_04g288150 [Oryza sativa Japonica Group]
MCGRKARLACCLVVLLVHPDAHGRHGFQRSVHFRMRWSRGGPGDLCLLELRSLYFAPRFLPSKMACYGW